MRQILYGSSSTVIGDGADLSAILEQSRHNNAIDGITGLLWSDGKRFLQVLEGPKESVALTWARIRKDARHGDIEVLQDQSVDAPEFGYWSMAYRQPGDASDIYQARVRHMVAHASPAISAPFLAMIADGKI